MAGTIPIEDLSTELRAHGFTVNSSAFGLTDGYTTVTATKMDRTSGRTITMKFTSERRATNHSPFEFEANHVYSETNREGILLSDGFRGRFPRETRGGGRPGMHRGPGDHGRGEHHGPGEHGK